MLETLAGFSAPDAPMASAFALCFPGRLRDMLEAAGAVVHDIGQVQVRRPDRLWKARRALGAVMAAQRYDVAIVHSSWSQALFGPTIQIAGTPLVRWLHAPDPGPAWLERWAARSPPALALYNSAYTRDGARARFAGVPSAVQYPMASWPVPGGGATRDDVRARLGASARSVVIAMAARLEPWKGHRLLIDALARLLATTWQAWIIGGAQRPSEQTYLSELQTAAAAAGLGDRVHFLGQRDDVQALLAAADIYCQPNAGAEPFGLSFVEALAAGLPVVTTRLGAAGEVVTDGCGLLVEPGSAADLTAALAGLVDDGARRRALGDAGRRRAASFCDLPASIARLAGTLRTASPSITQQLSA